MVWMPTIIPTHSNHNTVSLKRRILLFSISTILLIAAASPIFLRTNSEFDLVFKTYAKLLLQGEDIYHEGSVFMYPPWMAFICIPFNSLPQWLSRLSWGTINIFFFYLAIDSAWKISKSVFASNEKFGWIAFIIGLICATTYFLNCLSHQQFDVIIAGTILFGCLQLSKAKDINGGILLGVAAACKLTPLLFLPYLIYRFRWKAIMAFVVGFLFCNFIPDIILGLPPEGKPRPMIFVERFLAPMTKPDFVPGTWGSEIIYNQSLAGTGKRFTQTHIETKEGKYSVIIEPDNAQSPKVKPILMGLVLFGTAMTLFCWGWPGNPSNLNTTATPQFALEASMILCAMLLLSPMSSKAHFGILILPAFCLARMLESKQKALAIFFLAIPLMMGILLNKDLSGSNIYTLLLWVAGVTWSTISLFLGNAILRYFAKQQQLNS
jgi:Glycosyltransferase family 87